MNSYETGHVKRDPDSGAAAVRTIFPDDDSPMAAQAWLVATVNMGARFARTADVAGWPDLHEPAAAETAK